MKLKLSVGAGQNESRDVLVTADVTATVADVAARLAPAAVGPLTLRVGFPGRSQWRVLNPGSLVHDSGLRSGCRVEVVAEGTRQAGDDRAAVEAAVARVVSGPHADLQFTLAAGVNVVGRQDPAQVLLSGDKQVSRRHASITVDESVTVADLNSANGLYVDGRLVHRAAVTAGSRIQVGDSVLHVLPIATPGDAVASDDAAGFVRSPRVEQAYRGETVVLPEVPAPRDRPRFPVLAVIAPVVLGLVMFLTTKQLYSLIFVALSPIIMFGTWVDGRVQATRRRREEGERFEEGIEDARLRLERSREDEVAARTAESPSAERVLDAVSERTPLLWTRKPEHSTFLEVRFGIGALPSRSTVTLPSKNAGGVGEWRRAEEFAAEFDVVDPVPVVENLERAGAIGVAGSGPLAADAARALMVQLAGLHSPADLVVTALAAGEATAEWAWLKWLPHVDSPHSPVRAAGLASDYAAAGVLLSELEGLVAARLAGGVGRGVRVRSRLDEGRPLDAEHGEAVERLPATPAVVVLVTEHAPADRSRLVALAEEGPDAGVFLIWLAGSVPALPVACRTYLDIEGPTGRASVGFVRSGLTVPLHRSEAVDAIRAATAARSLAPVTDIGARVLDETDLPHVVPFVDLYEGDVVGGEDAIVQRWVKNDSLTAGWIPGSPRESGGIRAVVGQGPAEPFALDLREHGPHALVGGTTGAGKSEFLQSWIMGIATEYAPDRVTFLLVDYKGGAAFAECVNLPHTVGLVTDLTPHLVRRALTSLRAELRHREQVLNAKGAKDLEALERRSDPETPPALIIVIDEFAALATEVPEFVDGVIDVAQRGRSLGLHLVMATQRPSGVIKDSLRANTNLRVALRVADEADSVDVLGVPTASFFDPGAPGRAAAKLGPGRVHDFQAAYLGGQTRRGPADPDVQVRDLPFGPGAVWPAVAASSAAEGPRDIERLADTIARAADTRRIAVPRRPWLDQLPEVIDLDRLPGPETWPGVVPLGVLDAPETQRQHPFGLDWDAHGNIAVIGAGAAGKSTLLRTIAYALSGRSATEPVLLYGLDFAGGGLRMIDGLPTVGGVIGGSDRERVVRLFAQLRDELQRRAELFALAHAASIAEYRTSTGAALPRVVVLLDGFSAFRADYEFESGGSLFDRFLAVASTGRRLGVHLAMGADRSGAFPTGLSANIGQRIVLRLAGETEYVAAGVPVDVLEDAPAGRALVDGHEVQFAVPAGTPDLAEHATAFETLADRLRILGVAEAEPIRRLPELIPAAGLPAAVDGAPVLGVSDDTLEPVGLPTGGLFVVTGPFGSGRSTAMRTAIRAVRAVRPELEPYLLVARRSELRDAIGWRVASADADAAETLAKRLTVLLEQPEANRPELLLVVENVGDFAELPADLAVARLLKAARRAGTLALVETDTVTAASAWQLYTELKTARAGIVLQPEEGDGTALFRTQFPRVKRSEFPAGRGILVDSGRICRLQVAFSDE